MLTDARALLADAAVARTPADRYLAAHLAALKGAAALLAARAAPVGAGRRKLRSAWEQLPGAAPELREWATYFAASALKRASIEAGAIRTVSGEDAAELLREADAFVTAVEGVLGVCGQPSLPMTIPLAG
ncbi:SAV_6107 family HEPN domain-containing protein [Rhizohabitans arisaemae]|uniref:SAV_6107 family HEPN domain-containing protein n=1 Tax=Rhizohabitans arisaemae TaxID=2720610 RepID=UPI0024B14385|nr:SAV_6107 family HEPN domain-containing protein [Rhizohabitans arisaemae]